MSLSLGWRGWDIPWALLSLVPKGLAPIPEGFAPFLQLGEPVQVGKGWISCKGFILLNLAPTSSAFLWLPPSQLLLWCWNLSQKMPCIVGFTQPKKIQPLSPKLTKSPCSQTWYFCSQLPVEIWEGEALPAALAAAWALFRWELDAVRFWSGFWGGSEALGSYLMQKLGLGAGCVRDCPQGVLGRLRGAQGRFQARAGEQRGAVAQPGGH